jgi:hypothetical protein
MKQRCYDKSSPSYPNYGGRGIRVSKRWYHSFEEFLKDMGERPEGMTLDRIDNDKGYSKKNCRWASLTEQHNNRRDSIFVTREGETRTLTEWARELEFSPVTLFGRYSRGLRGDALFAPVTPRHLRNPFGCRGKAVAE